MNTKQIETGQTYMFVGTHDPNRKHLEGQPFFVCLKSVPKRRRYSDTGKPQRAHFYNTESELAYADELEPMPEESELPERIQIEAACVEFQQSGHTIWVQSPQGGTVLRIKCTGKILTERCKNSPVSHGDIIVEGDIHVCVSTDLVKF